MTLDTVACNQCAAPLAVPDGAKFVTCNHCGANLAIRRNESVTYSEIVEQIAEHTSDLALQVSELRFQNELNRLDKEWEQEREQYLIKTKYGRSREPNPTIASIGGIIAIVFAIFWMTMASSIGGGMFGAFGLVFIGIAIWVMLYERQKSQEYQRAQAAYQRRREKLWDERMAGPDEDEVAR
jgi:LSD1 subclass zinc finger protein